MTEGVHNVRYSYNNDDDSNESFDSEVSVNFSNDYNLTNESKHTDSKETLKIVNKSIYTDGYLKVILGCMFSGKTSYIIRECKKWQSIGKNVLMINYMMDKRYTDTNEIVSHDKIKVDCIMLDSFEELLLPALMNYDVILINEGQFFKNLRETVLKWCDELKKIVVVSGLDGDYLRGKFGEMTDLILDCDEIIKLKAYCSMCKDGTEAIFSWKTVNNTNNKNLIEIGTDIYVPLCRYHYNNQKNKMIANKKTDNNTITITNKTNDNKTIYNKTIYNKKHINE